MTEKNNVIDFLLDPELVNSYFLVGLGILTKAAKDPEAQKRLESLIKTFSDVAEQVLPNLPYIAAAYFGYELGVLGIDSDKQDTKSRVAGAGTMVMALKLAEAGNVVGAAMGAGYIALTGLFKAFPWILDEVWSGWNEFMDKETVTIDGKTYPFESAFPAPWVDGVRKCPTGYTMVQTTRALMCVPDTV